MSIYRVGVEREAIRCSTDGKISAAPHPHIFGDRVRNRFVSTDFGEPQIELITPLSENISECFEKLEVLTEEVMNVLDESYGEILWPYSLISPDYERYPLNDYTGYPEEEKYEKHLVRKYGYGSHTMSGIHFHFSFTDIGFAEIRKEYPQVALNNDEAYMHLLRNFLRHKDAFRFFYDAVPTDRQFIPRASNSARNDTWSDLAGCLSEIRFSSKADYIEDINRLLESGRIYRLSELYIPARPAFKLSGNKAKAVSVSDSIDNIEIRICDLNPFEKCGISQAEIEFALLFALYCMISEEKNAAPENIIESCAQISARLRLSCEKGIDFAINQLKTSKAERIRRFADIKAAMLELAALHLSDVRSHKYSILNYPKLEDSTAVLIKDAIISGIDYSVIDEEKCVVEFNNGVKSEIIVQATKTAKDNYIFPYVTDEKAYCKSKMQKAGIATPAYEIFSEREVEDAPGVIGRLINKSIVIKPVSENCGNGITVFPDGATEQELIKAFSDAFSFCDHVIAEEYKAGNEYRFFVVNGICHSVVWRRPACVTGDGKSSIRELVAIKESTPRFRLIDKRIPVDDYVLDMLDKQNLSLSAIIPANDTVFFRKASNASLGGETIDVTGQISAKFKRIAERTAKLFGAGICGIDIILPDMNGEEYNVLEINDNPGMMISEVPCEGERNRLGIKVLEFVGLL